MLDYDSIISIKISNSLLSYMFTNGVKDITVRIVSKEDSIQVIAEGKTDRELKDLDELNKLIKKERLGSVEDFYGNMLGISDNVNDIGLLGSMVDDGLIVYDSGLLTFYATRYKDK